MLFLDTACISRFTIFEKGSRSLPSTARRCNLFVSRPSNHVHPRAFPFAGPAFTVINTINIAIHLLYLSRTSFYHGS
nr:hypothetical protein [Candidatus Sigynarchaeota archaeon]